VLKVLSLLEVLSDVEGSMGRSDKMSVSVCLPAILSAEASCAGGSWPTAGGQATAVWACLGEAFRRRRMGLWRIIIFRLTQHLDTP